MTQYRLASVDLPSLRRHVVGFDRFFEDLSKTFEVTKDNNYPPYNLIKTAENQYTIEFAVAGFAENDLSVELHENVLRVSGKQEQDEPSSVEYIHRGIGRRSFSRTMTLVDNMEVRGATVKNGILSVFVEQIIPEEKKPKRIDITVEK